MSNERKRKILEANSLVFMLMLLLFFLYCFVLRFKNLRFCLYINENSFQNFPRIELLKFEANSLLRVNILYSNQTLQRDNTFSLPPKLASKHVSIIAKNKKQLRRTSKDIGEKRERREKNNEYRAVIEWRKKEEVNPGRLFDLLFPPLPLDWRKWYRTTNSTYDERMHTKNVQELLQHPLSDDPDNERIIKI